jgi:uncharacterized membrane protein YqjE
VVWLGRIGGGLVGFAVAVFFTEVVFPNNRENEPLIATAVLIVIGVFAGSWIARRRTRRT